MSNTSHSLIMVNFFDDANRSKKFFFHIQSNTQRSNKLKNDEEETRDWFDSFSVFFFFWSIETEPGRDSVLFAVKCLGTQR